MVYLLIIFLVLSGLIGIVLKKKVFNLLSIFNFMWAAIVFLANLQLYNMIPINEKIYWLIFIGCLSFTIGYIFYLFRPFKITIKNKNANKNSDNKIIPDMLMKIILCILMIAWLYAAYRVIHFLNIGYAYKYIRNIYAGEYQNVSMFPSKLLRTSYKILFVPLLYIFIVEIERSLFVSPKKKYYYIFALILIFLYCFSCGSRIVLVDIIIQLLFLFGIYKKMPSIDIKKIKKYVKYVIVLLVASISLLTVFRPSANKNEEWTSKMTYYAYVTLPVPLGGYWLDYIDSNDLSGHGYIFVRGFILDFEKLNIPLPNSFYTASNTMSYIADSYVPIFDGKVFNAFISIFLYFYFDFGFLGVIFGCIIYGVLCSYVEYNCQRRKSAYFIDFCLLFIISIIKSFTRWEFAQADYAMMFILLALIYLIGKNTNGVESNE